MTALFRSLLLCSGAMSMVILLLAALTPALSRRYASGALYYAWGIVALGLIFPLRPQIRFPAIAAPIGAVAMELDAAAAPGGVFAVPAQGMTQLPAAEASFSWMGLLCLIWAAGAVCSLAAHLFSHGRFLKLARRWSAPEKSPKALQLLEAQRAALLVRRPVALLRCSFVGCPMAIRFLKPAILLPEAELSEEELRLFLRHELTHIKRGDAWYKCLLLAAQCLHWFNPLVYWMARMASEACESACDGAVLSGAAPDERRRYSEALISMAKWGRCRTSPLATGLLGGKGGFRRRIVMILDDSPKKAGTACAALALAVTLLAGATITTSAAAGPAREPANTRSTVDARDHNAASKTSSESDASEDTSWKVQFSTVKSGETVKAGGSGYNLSVEKTYFLTVEWTGPEKPLLFTLHDEQTGAVKETREVVNGQRFSIMVAKTGRYVWTFANNTGESLKNFRCSVTVRDKEEVDTLAEKLKPFAVYGLQYDPQEEALYRDGARVKAFYDLRADNSFNIGFRDLKAQSALYLESVRDSDGKLIGIQRMTEESLRQIFGEDPSPYVLDATMSNPRLSMLATDKLDGLEIPAEVRSWLSGLDQKSEAHIYETVSGGIRHSWFYLDAGDRLAWLMEVNGTGARLYLNSAYSAAHFEGPTVIHSQIPAGYGKLSVYLDGQQLSMEDDSPG